MNSQASAQIGPRQARSQNAAVQPWSAIRNVRTGADTATPIAAPAGTSAVGIARLDSGNHLCTPWMATGMVGPSAAPSSSRLISRVANAGASNSGPSDSDHASARTSSTLVLGALLPTNPTATAVTPKSRKKMLPPSPNCDWVRPRSAISDLPARP